MPIIDPGLGQRWQRRRAPARGGLRSLRRYAPVLRQRARQQHVVLVREVRVPAHQPGWHPVRVSGALRSCDAYSEHSSGSPAAHQPSVVSGLTPETFIFNRVMIHRVGRRRATAPSTRIYSTRLGPGKSSPVVHRADRWTAPRTA